MEANRCCGRCDQELSDLTNVCLHCGYDLGERLIEIDDGLRAHKASRDRFRQLAFLAWVIPTLSSHHGCSRIPASTGNPRLTGLHGSAVAFGLGAYASWYLIGHAGLTLGWRAVVVCIGILVAFLTFTNDCESDYRKLTACFLSVIVVVAAYLHYLFSFV